MAAHEARVQSLERAHGGVDRRAIPVRLARAPAAADGGGRHAAAADDMQSLLADIHAMLDDGREQSSEERV